MVSVNQSRKHGACPACGGMLALEEHHADIGLTIYVCVECHHWYLTNWDIEAGLIKPRSKDEYPRRNTSSVDYQITGLTRIITLMCQRYDIPMGTEVLRQLDARINGTKPSRSRPRRVSKPRNQPDYGDDLVMTHNTANAMSALLNSSIAREGNTPFGMVLKVMFKAFKAIEDYPLEFSRYIDKVDLAELESLTKQPPVAFNTDRYQITQEDEISLLILDVLTGFIRHMRDANLESVNHE